MSQATPLARVKEEFGGKDKLVDKIVGLLSGDADESKDELRKRLLGAANKKLIRLHQIATSVKQHGGHDKLATDTAAGLGRAKDKDYVEKLGTFSNGRLLDLLGAVEKRAKRKSAAAAAAQAPAGDQAKARAARAPATASATGAKTKAAKATPKAATKGAKSKKKGKTASGKSA
ncbi:MAG TPA: hypothetical protein VMU50_01625 [Polyangia bacterium]|nr:hypothetical protein [Polyangia bacterium]